MNYQDMSIAKLEKERARLQKEKEEIKAQFKECGKVLEKKRRQRDLGELIEQAEAEIEALEPEKKTTYWERLNAWFNRST